MGSALGHILHTTCVHGGACFLVLLCAILPVITSQLFMPSSGTSPFPSLPCPPPPRDHPCHPNTGSEPDSEDDAPIAKRSKPTAAATAKGGAAKPKAPPSSSRQKPPAAKKPRAAAAADSDDVVMISSDSEDGRTQAGGRSTGKPRGAKKQVRAVHCTIEYVPNEPLLARSAFGHAVDASAWCSLRAMAAYLII
jgi:hypothetical protein